MLWKFVLIGLGYSLGDILMKTWILHGASFKNTYALIYFGALVTYGASFTFYAYQLLTTNLSIATVTPILINIVTVSLLSLFYYKEALTLYQGFGIAFALIAIILFSK